MVAAITLYSADGALGFLLFFATKSKAGSKSGQHAVKLSLQQQIDRSRATAKEYDHAYRRDVEVIKSIEESLISVFNKVRVVQQHPAAMGKSWEFC